MSTRWIEVLDPTAEAQVGEIAQARRTTALRGARLGILDNGKGNADHFLARLAERLQAAVGPVEIIYRRKHSYSRPAHAATLDAFIGCAAVVTAMGD